MGKAIVKCSISEEDFESLPPALRRKYFSTLERLRLASAADSTALPRNGRLNGSHRLPTATSNLRPPLLGRRSSTIARFTSRHLRKSLFATESYISSQIDAQWFLSLPPAIQRKKFTREEQVVLAGNQDTVILDAADEQLYRLRKQERLSQYSLTSLFSLYQHSNTSESSGLGDEEDSDLDSAVDMDERAYDSFRWLDDDEDLDLSLDDYHTHIAQVQKSEAAPSQPKRRSSFCRTLSITSLNFRRSSLSSQHPPGSSQSSATTSSFMQHGRKKSASRPFSTVLTPRHDPQKSQRTSIDPSAKYYQDPEARLKLRVYLASPQKFDEAVEFGFPSLTKENTPAVAQQSFLHDDNASLLADDDRSEVDSNAPHTPLDSAFSSAKTSKSPSTDNPGPIRPRLVQKISDSYTSSATGSREMTLKMTLTRPELRTTRDDINKPADNQDVNALKLAELSLGEENTPVWDSLPLEQNKVKKVWKKIRGRPN